MSILVTGGARYIGSHMVHALVESGERVVVLDNLSTGFKWAIPKGAELVIGETGDDTRVTRLIAEREVSAIIHFAASIVVLDSMSNPLGYYRNNTVNTRALIECAVRSGVKQFIFSSTAAVYGNPAKVPISEDDAVAPMSPYGSSKLMTEIMLRDAGIAHGLDYVILRYFNVGGADPSLRTGQSTKRATHLIKVAVETALGKRAKMEVFGTDYPTSDGTCIRDYIHVADLVRAHADALPSCGRAADQRRSTAATATDSPCLTSSTRSNAGRAWTFVSIALAADPAIRPGSWRNPTAPGSCWGGRRNSTISQPSSPVSPMKALRLWHCPVESGRRCGAPRCARRFRQGR